MQVSENFDVREFVGPAVWGKWKDKSIWFIDRRVIDISQTLRIKLGKPITINNWHIGGRFHESGLRTPGDETYKQWSQHSFGRAADLKVEGMTPEDVMIHIIGLTKMYRDMGLGAIEDIALTPSWLHFDCRYNPTTAIQIVRP